MKRAKGLTFFIAAVLILAFAYTAFFGISYYYGDIKFTAVKGLDGISVGSDFGSYAKAVFQPADGADATDEQLDTMLDRLLVRLTNTAYRVSESYIDYTRDRVVFDLGMKTGEDKYEFALSMDNLATRGRFTVRKGSGKAINAADESNVIFDNALIQSATAEYTDATHAKVVITLNEEGKQLWWDTTTLMQGQAVSAWIDDAYCTDFTLDLIVDSGIVEFTADDYTANDLSAMAYTINLGCLPVDTEVGDSIYVEPNLGVTRFETALVCLGAVALLACVFFIIRYRIGGVVISVALIGQLALLAAYFSGYVEQIGNSQLEIAGLLGAALAAMLTVACGVAAAEGTKRALQGGNSLDNSLRGGYKLNNAPAVDAGLVSLLVGGVIIGAWAFKTGYFTTAVRTVMRLAGDISAIQIGSLGSMLAIGGIVNAVMVCCVAWIMARSASKASYMRNPFLFGGNK